MNNQIRTNGKYRESRRFADQTCANGTTRFEHVLVVYQDEATHFDAERELARICREEGRVASCTWWKLADLAEPGVLAGASFMAMRANLIILSLASYEGMPLPFYVWVGSWLPFRRLAGGGLRVLTSESGIGHHSEPLKNYLVAVAQQAGMTFSSWGGEPRPAAEANGLHRFSRSYALPGNRLNSGKRCPAAVLVN